MSPLVCEERLADYCLLKRSDCDEIDSSLCPYHEQKLREQGLFIPAIKHDRAVIDNIDCGLINLIFRQQEAEYRMGARV